MGITTSTQPRDLKAEVKAIQELRSTFFSTPAKQLATKIANRTFAGYDSNEKAFVGNGQGRRSVLSIYSVIRRYDAKNN